MTLRLAATFAVFAVTAFAQPSVTGRGFVTQSDGEYRSAGREFTCDILK